MLVDFGLAEEVAKVHKSRGTKGRGVLVESFATSGRAIAAAASGGETLLPGSLANSSSRAQGVRPAVGEPRTPPRNHTGTRGFRAPECLLGITPVTPAVDVWAVGVILLSILSRLYPFFEREEETEQLCEIAAVCGPDALCEMAMRNGKKLTVTAIQEQEHISDLTEPSLGALPTGEVRTKLQRLVKRLLCAFPEKRFTAAEARDELAKLEAIRVQDLDRDAGA